MKITYPECQIEISVEEVIALIEHDKRQMPIQPLRTQIPIEKINELLGNTPGRIDDDFDPFLPTMKVPKAPALDEEPEPGSEPKPKQKSARLKRPKKEMKIADVHFEMGRPGQIPELKPMPKIDSGKKKKVDVRLDNGDWFTFDSVSAAAKSIGGSTNGLSTALKNGTKFHGHEVRWNNPELDAVMAEIDKSNKRQLTKLLPPSAN